MSHQILMLGGRRSGKSSILASIVYALGQNSELFSVTDQTDYTQGDGLGISLKAKRIEIDNYLRRRNQTRKTGNGDFRVDMSPNRGEGKYNLETQIHGASKVKFDFVDVQGESMEVSSPFHNRLKELVTQSDVFVIAIDTPYLMQDINENINTVWNRTDEITNLLAGNISIANEIDHKLIILCPVKCEKWTQNGRAGEVTDRVCQAYKRLINNWVNNNAVDIWVMPVETAGGIVHTRLLDGYRMFRGVNDKTGELCSINDLTGQIMLKNGEIISSSANVSIDSEPDPSLTFDFTQIPLSWYNVNGKGFAPARCEQPAFHIFRFLVKKEERALAAEKEAISSAPRWIRWWKKLWSPPFGNYLAAYSKLINDMESKHIIKTSGDGFRQITEIIH